MGKTYKDNPGKWRRSGNWKPKKQKGHKPEQRLTEEKSSVNYRHDDSRMY